MSHLNDSLAGANFLILVDETMDIDTDLATEQAEKMGRIDVKVDRVKSKKRRHPKAVSVSGFHKPLTSTAYAKDVVKDRHIRHAMM